MLTPKDRIFEQIDACRSLMLSSITPEGVPHASYAPFAFHQGCFYILISEAARHYDCLAQTPHCSLLLIESEEEAAQIFARRRVTLECTAYTLEQGDANYAASLQALQERFGEMITMLQQMGDFHLFELTPQRGEAVFGFGEAYTIENPFDTILPKQVGHRR